VDGQQRMEQQVSAQKRCRCQEQAMWDQMEGSSIPGVRSLAVPLAMSLYDGVLRRPVLEIRAYCELT